MIRYETEEVEVVEERRRGDGRVERVRWKKRVVRKKRVRLRVDEVPGLKAREREREQEQEERRRWKREGRRHGPRGPRG
jgi:hypothetical protein